MSTASTNILTHPARTLTDMVINSSSAVRTALGQLDKLPPELRNEIYRHALVTQGDITINSNVRGTITMKTAAFDAMFGHRATLIIRKPERSVAVSKVLTLQLIRTSKAIQKEASAILFGENHFVFTTGYSVRNFLWKLETNAHLLRQISVLNVGDWSHIIDLRRMQSPKIIEVGAVQGFCSAATAHALCTWFAIRPIVATRIIGVLPNGNDKVEELPVDAQLERLKTIRFAIPPNIEFEVSERETACVKDEDERQTRFHALIETYIQAKLGKGANTPMKLGSSGYGTMKVTRDPAT